MDVIYLDRLFGLNLLLDYCLVLASARVCGVVLRRARYLLAALTGALYARSWSCPGALARQRRDEARTRARPCTHRLRRRGALGRGARWCFSRFPPRSAARYTQRACSPGVSPGSGALVTVSGRVLVLSFAVCYAAVSTVFRRRAKTAAREVHTVTVTLAGRSTTVRALRDSGNDLHDPVSGLPAAVVERAAVLPAVSGAARAAGRRGADAGGARRAARNVRTGSCCCRTARWA